MKDDSDELIEIHLDDPILTLFILIVQTSRVVAKYIDSHLFRKLGISQVKFIVLMAFNFNPYNPSGAVTASDISRWTDTESHNITTLINRMKEEGLLSAGRDENDRRFVKISLTDKGRELIARATPVAQEVVDQVMSSISPDDAVLLEKLLRVIRQNAHDGLERLADINFGS